MQSLYSSRPHLTLDPIVRQSRLLSMAWCRLACMNALTLGLLLAGTSASALTAERTGSERTVSVSETVELPASPARTWDTIKDFNGWQTWHPAFASTRIVQGQGNTHGTVRVLTAKDGAQFTEELVSHSALSRSYQYRITASPLPITGYVSTLQVKPSVNGSSVVWSSHFVVKPGASEDEVKKVIAGVYRAGLDHLGAVVK